MAHPFITADSLGTLICEALEVNPGLVNRVIIDCDIAGGIGPVKVYMSMVGDARLLNVQWTDVLKGVDVITAGPKSKGKLHLTVLCPECNWAMMPEDDTVRCYNKDCVLCGKLFESPSIELKPFERKGVVT